MDESGRTLARMGLVKARDVLEEGATTATTVRDFRLVFEAYLHFGHTMLAPELGERGQAENPDFVQGCWLADRADGYMKIARLEQLLECRPCWPRFS